MTSAPLDTPRLLDRAAVGFLMFLTLAIPGSILLFSDGC